MNSVISFMNLYCRNEYIALYVVLLAFLCQLLAYRLTYLLCKLCYGTVVFNCIVLITCIGSWKLEVQLILHAENVSLAGMWSRSRHLSLETVSRSTNVSVSSRTKSSTPRSQSNMSRSRRSRSCLGFLGNCVLSRCFVQARAVHTVAAFRAILTIMTFVT